MQFDLKVRGYQVMDQVCSKCVKRWQQDDVLQMQDLNEEYEAALERRRLEVEAERRMQEEEDAKLVRALTAQQELPGDALLEVPGVH